MRAIDPIRLKQALAVSAILEDKKTIEQIIDEQPTIEPERIGDPDRIYAELSKVYNMDAMPDEAKAIIGDLMISLPDAPERKPGKWIYGEHDIAMCDGYWCNKCGFFVPWDYQHKSIDFIKDYHFCPKCGERMEGEDNERA